MNDQSLEHPENTRQWLTNAHNQLAPLLARRSQRVLLTEHMVDEQGQPRDVFAFFDRDPAKLMRLRHNWRGIVHTAQAVSRQLCIDQPAPPWPAFDEVQIPVSDEVRLSGRLGLAESYGQLSSASCIVILPGLYGDNGILRTRDLAIGLRRAGFHVLALELRGHGRTDFHYPEVSYTYGVQETQDLLIVSQWLEDNYPCIQGTGLVGFCWGGNLAMLAAWFDGRATDDESISPQLAQILGPPSSRRHYTAGVLAFSPVLRWEEIVDRCDQEWEQSSDPAMYYFQKTVRERKERKGFVQVDGNLRHLIAGELGASKQIGNVPLPESYRFLRFMPYRDLPCGDKLESARVPVIMVTASNDPFLSAQELADLTATLSNPQVASLILRGGGHIGFAPYNRAYYYSLIVNFFDPRRGAAAVGDLAHQRQVSSPPLSTSKTN
ncbi:MAG: alpha/beta fold hydrolase [Phycisphaerales bacterium]|nr:alpha/beta fold hydrolase [Phycisphaerales bacterium]